MESLVHIKYQDHAVHIARNPTTGHIVCFKYNQHRCDLMEFDANEYDAASDYILESLPNQSWGFVEDSE
jgi:hypothetical protein